MGQIVKRRDDGREWRLGKVTDLEPNVKVTNSLDDGSSTYTWDEIEADPDHPPVAIRFLPHENWLWCTISRSRLFESYVALTIYRTICSVNGEGK